MADPHDGDDALPELPMDDRAPTDPSQTAYVPASWSSPKPPPHFNDAELADYWRRVVGYLVDGFLLSIGLWAIERIASPGVIASIIVSFVAYAAYASILLARWEGHTVGMRLMGLTCVDAETRALPTWRQAIIRSVVAQLMQLALIINVILAVIPVLDLLWPLWDKANQTLHDKVGGTIVVRPTAEISS